METIDRILPISKELGCRNELTQLGDIVENNQAPYQRQIMQSQKNDNLSDIIVSAIKELEIGRIIKC